MGSQIIDEQAPRQGYRDSFPIVGAAFGEVALQSKDRDFPDLEDMRFDIARALPALAPDWEGWPDPGGG